ncbi:MAG TPA: glycogen/starch synthase, partial [Nevskiaceae bacterium]|nr:glycogen/starch synthase [Nevskiaceae bacterium]
MADLPTPHILMLGWEYPPRLAGGLGKASQGLARGLAACGADVLFVLPHYPTRRDGPTLRVTGADDWQGATPLPRVAQTGRMPLAPRYFAIPSALFPYARPPSDTRAGPRSWRPIGHSHQDLVGALYGRDLGQQVADFAARVAKLAAHERPDVVHANDWMSFPAAFAAAAPRRLPVFLHVHSTEYDRSGDHVNAAIAHIERTACARAAHVFAVSHYTAGILQQRYG